MRLTHKQKVKKARRMLTLKEIKEHTPIFLGNAWNQMKEAIKLKVLKNYEKTHNTRTI